jgi:superfamily II DNA or RNA helicase
MNAPTELRLYGFANPLGRAPMFLVPLFGTPPQFWIQDGRSGGPITRFFPCSAPQEAIIHYGGPETRLRVGDELIYAFAFSDEEIQVGGKATLQNVLSSRLAELQSFPFLFIDVLKFLNRLDALPEAIRKATDVLAMEDPGISREWAEIMESTLPDVPPATPTDPKPETESAAVGVPSPVALDLYQLTFQAPRRTTLALLSETRVKHSLFGETVRRRLVNLARLYDPRVPLSLDVGAEGGFEAERISSPFEWALAEGPRPDPKYCLQRLRALWLVVENRSGQITNDPVLPFRHQAALLQYLTHGKASSRALIADEVGLGKTVEAGLLIRHVLRQSSSTRILYLTLGGLVANVLEEFQRLDLPRFHFFANIEDDIWKNLNAVPAIALTSDTKLVVASMHKLCESDRWKEQHSFLGSSRFDLVIVDECHTLRAYGTAADSPQVWFRNIRQILEDHLTADGRVLFLSATPHQGKRDVFLNLVALCLGTPLNASEEEKARAARGRVIFRVKEHVRDWDGKRIFPVRDVKPPRLADPPLNYQDVLHGISNHFDWIASTSGVAEARTVGFVKSQALQYAASSLRAGFAYLLRRLIRHHPEQASAPNVLAWSGRLLPYRGRINSAEHLLEEWVNEFRVRRAVEEPELVEGELPEDAGPAADFTEVPRLFALLEAYDRLFDDPAAGAKFNTLNDLLSGFAEPVVIFSQAVDTVYELESRLKSLDFEVYRLTGDMPMEDRPASIRAFCRSTNPRRVLISSAAGGVGINLQIARIVVHFDLPWNPMVLEQRVGRVHRIGSTRTILVETILLKGSREAEVFSRITERLQEIVRDLSADVVEREALFRRILASLDPDRLREMLSGEIGLEAVGAAVEAGRKAVDEADKYMRDLAAQTSERRGKATMAHLVQFLRTADPGFGTVGNKVYAVVAETSGGELRQDFRQADVFQFEGEDELVFDRTAASYLGLRRNQTGGLGNSQVDPLIRAAIDLSGEPKSRMSTWVIPGSELPSDLQPSDLLYFAFEAGQNSDEFAEPTLRAWRVRRNEWLELSEDVVEELLWKTDWMPSRKAGEVVAAELLQDRAASVASSGRIHYPLAAIGIRERTETR